nr:hypothetical protein [Neorhizobium galegae]
MPIGAIAGQNITEPKEKPPNGGVLPLEFFHWRNTMQQLAKFLTATGRRLRTLGKVISHFFRKGKLGLKLAIKIPFFIDIEVTFETNWNRRP